MKNRAAAESDWTARDAALWTTAELATLHKQGRLSERRSIPVTFTTRIRGAEENIYTHAPMFLESFQAQGDGSYVQNRSTLVASGRGAGTAMAAFAVGRAIGNSRRRAAAQAAAQPRWALIERGGVFVGSHGFYLQPQQGLLPWSWDSIHQMALIGPGKINLHGDSTKGPINWILTTDLAELIFYCWAAVRCPTHPQFTGNLWLPQDWLTRAFVYVQGRDTYPTTQDFHHLQRVLSS